jgi:surface antigen
MKKLIALVVMGLTFAISAPAFAGAQQEKMKGCNAEAKSQALKGADRKAFMSKCLKKDYVLESGAAPAAAAAPTQQNKMKTCNADAKTKALKGAERKEFMSACLSA